MKRFYFTIDKTTWALPLYVDWSRSRIFVNILCFEFNYLLVDTDFYLTPEEELKELNDYAEHTLQWLAEERAEIQKRMGLITS